MHPNNSGQTAFKYPTNDHETTQREWPDHGTQGVVISVPTSVRIRGREVGKEGGGDVPSEASSCGLAAFITARNWGPPGPALAGAHPDSTRNRPGSGLVPGRFRVGSGKGPEDPN